MLRQKNRELGPAWYSNCLKNFKSKVFTFWANFILTGRDIIAMKSYIHSNHLKNLKVCPSVLVQLVFCCLLFIAADVSFAIDEGGCLTCHQFPGLVRHEKGDGFKVLHIDEASYVKSAHGKVDCRKCHTRVVKVPHTGETHVDCNSACHLEEKDRQLVKNYPLKDFHKGEQSFITRLDDETACRVCHPLYPHAENKLVRALLNLHTGFMVCDVCHLKKENYPDFTYHWKDTENADFSGQPFGTYYNPKTQTAHKSEHFLSRIAVYVKNDGERQLTFNPADTRKAKEFLLKEKNLTNDQRTDALNYFHRDIAKKEISVACDECHSFHSILDFKQLGFSEKTATNLKSLNIKGLVTKYKTFYFPDLFEN